MFQENCFDQNRSLHLNDHGQTSSISSPTIPVLQSMPPVDSTTFIAKTEPTSPEMPTQISDSATSDTRIIEADSGSMVLAEPPDLPVSPGGHHMRTRAAS